MPRRAVTLNVEVDVPADYTNDDIAELICWHLDVPGTEDITTMEVDPSAATFVRAVLTGGPVI